MNIKKEGDTGKHYLLDSVFPLFCLGCRQEGDLLCQSCFDQIQWDLRRYCGYCFQQECLGCSDGQVLRAVYSFTVFDNKNVTSQLITLYKYGFVMIAGDILHDLVLRHVSKKSFHDRSFDILTVLPLHKKRLAYRGFNQSEIFADALGSALGLTSTSLILRKRHTRQQVQLTRADRLKNVKDAFVVASGDVNGKNIALVDDVFTSGATLQEAAKALYMGGAGSVYGITIAHGK